MTETKLRCPHDGLEMTTLRIGEIVVDRCDACGGIWFDLGEMQAILGLGKDAKQAIEELDRPGRAASAPGRVPVCPRDGSILTSVRDPKQPHVAFDLCVHCGGIFLQSGELTDLSEFTLRERVRWMFRGVRD